MGNSLVAIIRRVDYFWRLFATGLSFLLFGIAGLILSFTVFPVLFLFNRELRQSIARNVIRYSWKMYIFFMENLGVLDFETEGLEALQSDRGVIVIANHPSLLDIVLLISMMKNTQCIVKQGVWNNPVMRSAVRSANYIPNSDDPEELLRKCGESLAMGNNIVIFPEGSRSTPGTPMKLQRGFAQLACRVNAPLRLVEIRCDPPTLLKGQKWYDIPPTRPRFVVRVAERLDMSAMNLDDARTRAVRQVTRHVAARYEEMLEHGRA